MIPIELPTTTAWGDTSQTSIVREGSLWATDRTMSRERVAIFSWGSTSSSWLSHEAAVVSDLDPWPKGLADSFSNATDTIAIKGADMLSGYAVQIIGEHGLQRFLNFQRYQKGWDFGRGEPLSSCSTGALEYFLNLYSAFDDEPSLFLTDNGNLSLGWESRDGGAIELEFFPDKIEYYIEKANIEGSILINKLNIDWLISTLNSIN
jgi:hypothetical protein